MEPSLRSVERLAVPMQIRTLTPRGRETVWEARPGRGSPRPRSYLAGLVLAAAAAGTQGPQALLLLLLHFGLQVLDVHQVGLLLGLPRAQLQLQGLLLLLQEVELGLQLGHLLLRSTEGMRHPRCGSRTRRGKAGW